MPEYRRRGSLFPVSVAPSQNASQRIYTQIDKRISPQKKMTITKLYQTSQKCTAKSNYSIFNLTGNINVMHYPVLWPVLLSFKQQSTQIFIPTMQCVPTVRKTQSLSYWVTYKVTDCLFCYLINVDSRLWEQIAADPHFILQHLNTSLIMIFTHLYNILKHYCSVAILIGCNTDGPCSSLHLSSTGF